MKSSITVVFTVLAQLVQSVPTNHDAYYNNERMLQPSINIPTAAVALGENIDLPSSRPSLELSDKPTTIKVCPPAYDVSAAKTYIEGSEVEVGGYIYRCNPFPYWAYCAFPEYKPLSPGELWMSAWQIVSSCVSGDTNSPSKYPTSAPTVKLAICPPAYDATIAYSYVEGSEVEVESSVYRCNSFPYDMYCRRPEYQPHLSNDLPWHLIWQEVATCETKVSNLVSTCPSLSFSISNKPTIAPQTTTSSPSSSATTSNNPTIHNTTTNTQFHGSSSSSGVGGSEGGNVPTQMPSSSSSSNSSGAGAVGVDSSAAPSSKGTAATAPSSSIISVESYMPVSTTAVYVTQATIKGELTVSGLVLATLDDMANATTAFEDAIANVVNANLEEGTEASVEVGSISSTTVKYTIVVSGVDETSADAAIDTVQSVMNDESNLASITDAIKQTNAAGNAADSSGSSSSSTSSTSAAAASTSNASVTSNVDKSTETTTTVVATTSGELSVGGLGDAVSVAASSSNVVTEDITHEFEEAIAEELGLDESSVSVIISVEDGVVKFNITVEAESATEVKDAITEVETSLSQPSTLSSIGDKIDMSLSTANPSIAPSPSPSSSSSSSSSAKYY